ncbi:hypothetical protein Tsubulata_036141 [Turnera subulata]|uniref:Protein MIZU-KUSSEI 1 n=1 Tax=Turnera subulata TaxID=218843 RepID=A0A9Q0G1B9_9ROSI|nr:hypothetical protein Tsubulata_036141 [Turnera subulata]
MTKIDSLRRCLLPCFSPPTTTSSSCSATAIVTATTTTTKKRISSSLRDDLDHPLTTQVPQTQDQDQEDSVSPDQIFAASAGPLPPPRRSRTMVIGTIFGHRHGHVWLCIQHNRLSAKPLLLLELSIATHQLVKEMQCGLVRIAFESARPDLTSCPLRSVPAWTMFCNGKRVGFAARRRASEQNRLMLKTMQSITVGAGVIPAGFGSSDSEDIIYMRANYEHVVGSADSEAFHLMNLEECPGQELSVFLMRTR